MRRVTFLSVLVFVALALGGLFGCSFSTHAGVESKMYYKAADDPRSQPGYSEKGIYTTIERKNALGGKL
jgi:hypothetical protein